MEEKVDQLLQKVEQLCIKQSAFDERIQKLESDSTETQGTTQRNPVDEVAEPHDAIMATEKAQRMFG